MNRRMLISFVAFATTLAVQVAGPTSVAYGAHDAAQAPAALKVCELLPKAEVKKLIGGNDAFDRTEPKEEPAARGSSCTYAGLLVSVGGGTIDGARQPGSPFESFPGVGDEAYVYNNPAGGVDFFVRVGSRLVVVSRAVEKGGNVAAAQPGVVALAKAVIAKLPPISQAADPKVATELDGAWNARSVERDGTVLTQFPEMSIVFKNDKASMKGFQGAPGTESSYTYSIDPKTTPKALTLKSDADPVIVLAVYELNGDTLRMTLGRPGAERPAKVSSAGAILVTFTRTK